MTLRRPVLVAVILWLVFAAVVWNVVFDRMLVLAGRRYAYDAVMSLETTGRYLLIDDVMRPAIARAVRTASVVAAAIVVASLLVIRVAARRDSRRRRGSDGAS